MKRLIIALCLLLPICATAQQTDPTHEEFATAVSVTVRYLEAVRRTQQTETAEILDIQAKLTILIEQTNKRIAALEADNAALRAELATVNVKAAAPSQVLQNIRNSIPAP